MIAQILLAAAAVGIVVAGLGTVVCAARRPSMDEPNSAARSAIRRETADFRRQLIYGRPTLWRRPSRDERVVR